MSLDLSSYKYLRKNISRFFNSRGESFVYADPLNPKMLEELLSIPREKIENVVLVGGFLARALLISNLPNKNLKLWVLCSSARSVLEGFLGSCARKIGILPRFYRPHPRSAQTELGVPSTFIYAGRLSQVKGVMHLLRLVRCLQTQYDLPVGLKLIGPWSDMEAINFNSRDNGKGQFQKKVHSYIQSHSWVYAPQIHRPITGQPWAHVSFVNPIFVSLSYLSHEDYGVSLDEALSAGWPAILSSWGGHLDVPNGNILYLKNFFPKASDRQEEEQALKNARTGANQIVQLSGTSQLPAVDGSQLTNLTPANLASAVGLDKGGTGANLTASSGGIIYSGASAMAISAPGNAGEVLISGGTGAPSFSSAIVVSGGNVGIGKTPGDNLDVNGNIQATAYFYSSDRRLKTNFEEIRGLETILKLNGVKFQWKESGRDDIGLIAQEVEKVLPELVKTDKHTGLKAVQYGNLVAPLIESVKDIYGLCEMNSEQIKQVQRKLASHDQDIRSLKSDLELLKNENAQLKNEIEQIKKLLLSK